MALPKQAERVPLALPVLWEGWTLRHVLPARVGSPSVPRQHGQAQRHTAIANGMTPTQKKSEIRWNFLLPTSVQSMEGVSTVARHEGDKVRGPSTSKPLRGRL